MNPIKSKSSSPADADIVIVGASFAGLAAARTAAMRGLRVTVIDAMPGPGAASNQSSPAPGPKPCDSLEEWMCSGMDRLRESASVFQFKRGHAGLGDGADGTHPRPLG